MEVTCETSQVEISSLKTFVQSFQAELNNHCDKRYIPSIYGLSSGTIQHVQVSSINELVSVSKSKITIWFTITITVIVIQGTTATDPWFSFVGIIGTFVY